MSGLQLGRVGIVLLALHTLLSALLSGISGFSRLSATGALSGEAVAFSLGTFVVVVLLLGALPATILIANRGSLSRLWFGGDAEPELSIAARDLFQVGLMLLAVSGIWEGVMGLVAAGVLSASLNMASDTQLEKSAGAVSGAVFRSAADLAIGALLLRIAKPLSERWF